jgi:uncharacterized protein
MKIFLTGASGLLGTRLRSTLQHRGDTVVSLSRQAREGFVQGDPGVPGPWLDELTKCDAVVHLAGEPILARRWNDRFLAHVERSRVESTRLIAETLAKAGKPSVFISGSATGFYGSDRGDTILNESSAAGSDTLAKICIAWEQATEAAQSVGVRVACVRTGIVLDPEGGALPKMLKPFKMFAGGRIGNGMQFMSWIHHEDMTRALLHALETSTLRGPFNATAPNTVTNAEFSRVVAKVFRRPNWLPVPKFMLRLLVGRAAEVVTGSVRAVPDALLQSGFTFRHPTLEDALRDLLNRPA